VRIWGCRFCCCNSASLFICVLGDITSSRFKGKHTVHPFYLMRACSHRWGDPGKGGPLDQACLIEMR